MENQPQSGTRSSISWRPTKSGPPEGRDSPEWKVVLACLRGALNQRTPSASEQDLPVALVDWRRVAEIAWQHRVAPLVYRSLRRGQQTLTPVAAVGSLKEIYLATAARNTVLFRALEQILEALARASLPVIVLKGALLADTVYPERAVRPMSDIDLLVREEHLEAAEASLREIGYEAMHDAQEKAELRAGHHHWVFRSGRPILGGIPLEIHWNLHPPAWPFRVDLGGLWERAVSTRVAGVPALGLAPEDLLLHLCTHVARGRFNGGLISLCDIAAVSGRHQDRLDWPVLQTRADQWRASSYVSVALDLTAELLGAPIPITTLEGLRKTAGDRLLDLTRERVLEEKGALRAAAELRLRWRSRGWSERAAAFREVLSSEVLPRPGRNEAASSLGRLREVVGRYLGWGWSLMRHPRAVSAIAQREARKSSLDSWCSPSRVQDRAGRR